MVYINEFGQICCDDYLAHHGVLGQKWGRKNGPPYPLGASDHSAAEKKAGWEKSLDKTVRTYATGDTGTGTRLVTSIIDKRGLMGLLTSKRHRERRVGRLEEKAKKAVAEDNTKKAEKLKAKASAQKQKNADMEAYFKKTSTAKLAVQEVLLKGIAIDNYRSARARGAGRVRALLETNAGVLPISTLLRVKADKKKYGAITHSAM